MKVKTIIFKSSVIGSFKIFLQINSFKDFLIHFNFIFNYLLFLFGKFLNLFEKKRHRLIISNLFLLSQILMSLLFSSLVLMFLIRYRILGNLHEFQAIKNALALSRSISLRILFLFSHQLYIYSDNYNYHYFKRWPR